MSHRPILVVECHGVDCAKEVFRELSLLNYYSACYLKTGGKVLYKILNKEDVDRIRDLYDIHYIVASPRVEDLIKPIPIVDPMKFLHNKTDFIRRME